MQLLGCTYRPICLLACTKSASLLLYDYQDNHDTIALIILIHLVAICADTCTLARV